MSELWHSLVARSGSALLLLVLAVSAVWATNASGGEAVRASVENPADSGPTSDSLRFEVQAGRPLIVHLPDSVGGRLAESYESVHIPALSWRRGRAFFWQTTSDDGGLYSILFRVVDVSGRADTLTLLVEVSQ